MKKNLLIFVEWSEAVYTRVCSCQTVPLRINVLRNHFMKTSCHVTSLYLTWVVLMFPVQVHRLLRSLHSGSKVFDERWEEALK